MTGSLHGNSAVILDDTRHLQRSVRREPMLDGTDEDLLWEGTRRAIDRAGLEILGELAESSRRAVFDVRDSRTGRRLALKVLLDPDDRRALTEFRRERRVLASEFVPNHLLPRYVTSVAGEEMQPFVVMERIDGQPIIEAACRLNVAGRVELVRHLFAAVASLHASNLLHGGLSPECVLVTAAGQIRLLSFGRSRRLESRSWPRSAPVEETSPAGVTHVRGSSTPGSFDLYSDLCPAAEIACRILTEKDVETDSRTARSDDGTSAVHESANRSLELERAGVPAPVQQVIAKALRQPDERGAVADRYYESAGQVAEDLSRWLDRRGRRQRLWKAALGMLAAVAVTLALNASGWAGFGRSNQNADQQRLAVLEQQAAEFQFLQHPLLDAARDRANRLQERQAELLASGNDTQAAALQSELRRELNLVVQAGRGIERAVPIRLALRQVLGSVPWARDSRFITERLAVLESRFRRTGQQLDSGELDTAWQSLQALERDLAQLVSDNAEAASAVRSRQRFLNLKTQVAERLRMLDGFERIEELDGAAAVAWNAGDWSQAGGLYGSAQQQLQNWLRTNETFNERITRELKSPELAAQFADRDRRSGMQLDELTEQRDELADQVMQFEAAQLAAQTELATSRTITGQLEAKLTAALKGRGELQSKLDRAERDLQQTREELGRLQSELNLLARRQREQEADRESLAQRLTDLDRRLTTTQQVASQAGRQAEEFRSELELWKQIGGSATASAVEIARQERELATRIERLSGQDRQQTETLVREAEDKLSQAERQRTALLRKFSPDSPAVRTHDQQLVQLEMTLVAAVTRLSEIEVDLYRGLQEQIAAERKTYEQLTTTQKMKPTADEPRRVQAAIAELSGQAARYEPARRRLEAIKLGDQDVARTFARDLSFAGQSVAQRLKFEVGNWGPIAVRWVPVSATAESKPGDTRSVSGFWILETEVTQALFAAVTGQSLSDLAARRSVEADSIGNEADDVPVYFVSQGDAQRFCEHLTDQLRREGAIPDGWRVALPSESQWQHAAEAGRRVADAALIDEYRLTESAWFSANAESAAQPVGRKAPNAWGLLDMVGNVYEWVRAETSPKDGVVRGASWGSPAEAASIASRRIVDREFRSSEVGFRFVVEHDVE
ncbi:SUMF1/EgtB/PvdO family nonheme iron enzyme [bacterium]|nr:SUMF1/EgtB/PvdO family nonheme iron enzyme [bacterium]